MKKRNWARTGVFVLSVLSVLAMAAVVYASGGEAHHGGGITSEKLWDLLYRTLNFAGLVIILVYFLKKPIANGLSARREAIRAEIEDLESRRAESERAYKECEAKFSGLEAEAAVILEEAVKQGEVEKQRIIDEGERAAADMKRQAEMAVAHELAVAKANLKAEIADQAVQVAEELIKKNLQSVDQSKMIEESLDKVGGIQ